MNQSSQKIGFWSVFALVIGSQIGSGVLMLPSNLAPYGLYSILAWIISGFGAITLALVFAKLCSWFPKTGGPHVYVNEAFGASLAFFTGWTYWVISWISTTVVIIASIGYLVPLIGTYSSNVYLILEILLLFIITLLNFRGVSAAGHVEFLLSALKVIPLCLIPLCAFFYFDIHNFSLDTTVSSLSIFQLLSRVTLLTLWGFIGVESATTPAGSVENPAKTIPRALVAGTICVAFLYLINSLAVLGVIPGAQLVNSNAPYVDAAQVIFGGNWHLVVALIASIICIGTLNAWMLTSGQIALGLAQDGFLPVFFGYKNSYGAPWWALLISCIGIIPLLIMTANKSLVAQVLTIIDFSVTAFLFVYALCCLAFLKILFLKKGKFLNKVPSFLYGFFALIFCVWIIYEIPFYTLLIASLFTVSGVPFYMRYWFKQRKHR